MTNPARIRFRCFGCSSSRLTWARVSSPDIARIEWPMAIRIPMRPSSLPAPGERPQCDPLGVPASPAAGRTVALLTHERPGQELRHPAHGVVVEGQVRAGSGARRQALLLGVGEDRQPTPEDHQHDHRRRHPHDPEGVVRGLVDAPDVAPPEVEGDRHRDHGREVVDGVLRWRPGMAEVRDRLRGRGRRCTGPADAAEIGPVRM